MNVWVRFGLCCFGLVCVVESYWNIVFEGCVLGFG